MVFWTRAQDCRVVEPSKRLSFSALSICLGERRERESWAINKSVSLFKMYANEIKVKGCGEFGGVES